MKTQALKIALDKYQFDLAFGGARRDEEKSRAKKEFSLSDQNSMFGIQKNQRPELWNNFNTRKSDKESIRVFPLSNWTELDIWQYIYEEKIDIVPLYFSSNRNLVSRNGMLIDINDERLKAN